MTEWLGMDSAPKDAVEVQLLLEDVGGQRRTVLASWANGQWWGHHEDGAFSLKNEKPIGWRPVAEGPPPSVQLSQE